MRNGPTNSKRHGSALFNSPAVLRLLPAAVLLATIPQVRILAASGVRSVNVATSQLVLRAANGERDLLNVTIDSAGLSQATVRLTSPSWNEAQTKTISTLPKGKQTVEIEAPEIATSIPVTVSVEAGGQAEQFGPFTVVPPRRWVVYLTEHAHTDIGYTRPQTEILPEHLRYIDYALDYCDLTDHYPNDARFRWTCEASWPVEQYLKYRPAEQIERLKRRVQEGRIEITGMMINMSELASENSLDALLQPIRMIHDELGVPVTTAMQDDVNGIGWCLVDYFNGIGIRYVTMGINETRSILPFDKPTAFWWESPSGKRVLAYRGAHYMLGNFWHIQEGDIHKFRPAIDNYLKSLVARHYPFDHASAQFSGYFTDNSPPSTIACDLVRAWNKKYASPHLRLSTIHEFPAWVEKTHGADLPVHRQAWPDWWTDGFGSAARETAQARLTDSGMQANYGLLAMASMLGAKIRPQTMQRAAAVEDDLLFYAEHTFGAAESVSDPMAENSKVQWGEKSSYVWKAVVNSHLLREEAMGLIQPFLPRGNVPTIAIFNTLNWSRSGLVRVYIDHEMLPPNRDFRILDGSQPVPVQAMASRSDGTYWALWVSNVPPLGFKILRIETSGRPRPPQPKAADSLTLENAFYKLRVDPKKGAIKSLLDKETGEELVDPQCPWDLGQCIYETMPDRFHIKRDAFKRTTVRNVKVTPGADGPIWKSLLVTEDMDGCDPKNGIRVEIRLYKTAKRVELHFDMRKLPVLTPEAVYVALPFQPKEGKILYEAQGGMVRPGKDQIPGSASDWQTVQNFIAVRGYDSQIIAGSAEAPLVQLGDFNIGKWQRVTHVERPWIYSWVMNNYWFTNFRAEQDGEFRWHYYLTSTTDMSRTAATRFGWGSRVPLLARVLPPVRTGATTEPQSLSTLSIDLPDVLVVEARPMRDGDGVLLHLRETGGKTVTLTQDDLTTYGQLEGADEVNVLGQVINGGIESLTLHPYEVKFVSLTFQ